MNFMNDMLGNHCPRCRKGSVFRGIYMMNRECPVCGLIFEKENGYFLGAMVVSYFLAGFSVIPTVLLLRFYYQTSILTMVFVPCVQVVLMNPLLFHASRMVWLYIDHAADPKDRWQ